jgi:hypothetical protein
MRSAELAATVRTLKRQKSFLPAFLAFHSWHILSMLKGYVTVYTFLCVLVVGVVFVTVFELL